MRLDLGSVPTFILYSGEHQNFRKRFSVNRRIGYLSEVSRDTLRHYEREGVLPLPVRSANGYRLYSTKSVERVKLIRRCLAVGFTLDELARIFAERKRGNGSVPRSLFALKLRLIMHS